MIDVAIVGAGARGNRVFADLIARHETGFRTTAVVEIDPDRRQDFQARYRVPSAHAFATLEEFLAAPRSADIVFICTLDPTHYEICRAVSEQGYDVLLEKPIATNLADCLALLAVEQASHNRIFVTHVLRYTPFFRRLKELIASGEFGAVQAVDLSENIGHWHYAHSYVRGNWRRSDSCAPIVLTKSSHDLDILPWLVGEPVTAVLSYGGLRFFRPEHAPAGAAARCVDCSLQDSCLYSATRFYLAERSEWPYDVIAGPHDSPASRRRALEEGPYGRCVWHCDNDVCDHQTVVLEFASGLHASLTLSAHTADNTRKIRVLLDKAELVGDVGRDELTVSRFTGEKARVVTEPVLLPAHGDSHGGGDLGLLMALGEHLAHGSHREMVTSLRSSLLSHVLAFLAEDSRQRNSVKLPVSEILLPPAALSGPA